ncbi:MAG: UDP-N-acetylmuramoyl-L-alanine--D-glutamate ligase [Actinobacteria bacterium]|nr:UDP-N-acetylmuramoyl-L-alanine--D-glutamate ligase [Actinomycetota bacterium]
MIELAGTRVIVIGLGVSGYSAARILAPVAANVRVSEERAGPDVTERAAALRALAVEVEIGGHDLSALDADLVVVSPGVSPDAPVVRAAREKGLRIIGEIELAFQLASCDFLAVTGTNGKTTTTSLLAAMLRESNIPSTAAGNIGLPLIEAVQRVGRGGAIALEVSSFQLATIEDFRAKVAVVLNVAEDHTDWHGGLERYAAAKARITENQRPEDSLLFNREDERALAMSQATRARVVPFSSRGAPPGGIGVDGCSVVWRGEPVLHMDDLSMPGQAGIDNTIAAVGAALEYGLDHEVIARAVKAFEPLPHRMQTIAEIAGVTYINDSKATNPHATLAAVRGLTDVVLIAGGRSKGMDLASLAGTAPPVRSVIALGEARDELRDVFAERAPVTLADSMTEAVKLAAEAAGDKGSVLLSPGCASLDMYRSYAERGQDFTRAVLSLDHSGTRRPEEGREHGKP